MVTTETRAANIIETTINKGRAFINDPLRSFRELRVPHSAVRVLTASLLFTAVMGPSTAQAALPNYEVPGIGPKYPIENTSKTNLVVDSKGVAPKDEKILAAKNNSAEAPNGHVFAILEEQFPAIHNDAVKDKAGNILVPASDFAGYTYQVITEDGNEIATWYLSPEGPILKMLDGNIVSVNVNGETLSRLDPSGVWHPVSPPPCWFCFDKNGQLITRPSTSS